MANISHITLRRYGTQSSPYNPETANQPIDDMKLMIDIVNEESSRTSGELDTSRGSAQDLSERLDKSMLPDGSLKSGAVSQIDIGNIISETNGVGSDRVIVTKSQVDKLSGISSNANFMTLRIGEGPELNGVVRVVAGSTVKLSPVRSSDGSTTIKIDTIFTGDRVHEHKSYQDCTIYSKGIAYIPNLNDDPIPGTVEVYLNGQLLRRTAFEEHVDHDTGKIDGAKIRENPEAVQLSSDNMWFSYQTRPTKESGASDMLGEPRFTMFDHNIVAADLRPIRPLSGTVSTEYRYWLIKLPEDLRPPYSGMLLFVSEDPFPHAGGVRGMTARQYGRDWDVISFNGLNYLRWRFDETNPVTGPTSTDDGYDFLTHIGSGSEFEVGS